MDPFGDDWFVNNQGFYLWSNKSSIAGFEYAGNQLPDGTPRYKVLVSQNGVLYHKYTSSPVVNFINSSFDTKLNPLKRYDHAEESFNEEMVSNAIGFGVFKVGGLAFKALKAAGGSIWKLPVIGPGARGFVYEQMIGLKGLMKAPNFPVIDAFYNGVATSVKTMDIFAKKYIGNSTAIKKQILEYADKLAAFEGASWGGQTVTKNEIKKRVLEIGIPKGASESVINQIKEAVAIASKKGIKVNVRVVK
jgi:hypothetical protein